MNTIFLKPMLLMMLITFAVWLCLYAKRLPYLLKNQIVPQSIATPKRLSAKLPEHIQYPAHNLHNLSELPIIFYTLCLTATYLNIQSDSVQLLAWGFVILRGLHSLIHCSTNQVTLRFSSYMLSSIVLWLFLADMLLKVGSL